MTGLGLSDGQIQRYSRHILLAEVGGAGQEKLLRSSAFVVGAGGLGSAALLYLAGAGVGRLGVADSDVVELSNLHRQVLHGTSDLGRSKVVSAAQTIKNLNPDCKVELVEGRLGAGNIRDAIRAYDVVLDGSDNFPTRYLVADACWLERKPLVSAAVVRFEGQLLTVIPGENNPCYRCLYPEPPPPDGVPTCQEAGVLGAVVGVMGTLQAVEALKVLLGIGDIMSHRLLAYDALKCRFVLAKRSRDPACRLCGDNPCIFDLREYEVGCEGASGGPESSPGQLVGAREVHGRPGREQTIERLHTFSVAVGAVRLTCLGHTVASENRDVPLRAGEQAMADEREALFERLRPWLDKAPCATCDCLQGALLQLELEGTESLREVVAAHRVPSQHMHQCLGCDLCPPGRAWTEYLTKRRGKENEG